MRRSSVVRFHGRRSPRSSAEEQRVSTPRVAGSSPAGELSQSRLVVGEFGHPTGFGRRRSQVRVLPTRFDREKEGARGGTMGSPTFRSQVRVLPTRLIALSGAARGRGAAVLASLMSSRPWVRIPPAPSTGTVRRRAGREVTEQGLCRARALTCGWAVKPPGPTGEEVAACQSRRQDCRKVEQPAPEQKRRNVSASGCGEPIPPSIFFLGGRGVTASIRGRDPRRCRFEPDRPPSFSPADAEHRRAQRAVTVWLHAVVVRLHPSALDWTAEKEGCRTCSVAHNDMGPARRHSLPWSRPRPGEDRAVPHVARGGTRATAGAPGACRRDPVRPGRPTPHHGRAGRRSRGDRGGGAADLTSTAGAARRLSPQRRRVVVVTHVLPPTRGHMGP